MFALVVTLYLGSGATSLHVYDKPFPGIYECMVGREAGVAELTRHYSGRYDDPVIDAKGHCAQVFRRSGL